MAEYVNVSGLADIQRMLDTLPAKIEANVMRGALRAGSNVIRDEAKRLAPVKGGALRASIRVSLRLKAGRIAAQIKAGDKRAWYAHLVEFGTARHWIKPKNRKSLFFSGLAREIVDHPGGRPVPFMRQAFDAKATAALDAVAEYARTRLPKELRKVGR